jgi:hypothetical protein
MKRLSAIVACATGGLVGCFVLSAAAGPPAATGRETITCPYLQAELRWEAPQGDLPLIAFDYPSKVTAFSFRDGHLLLVAMDEAQPSRLRVVISAQRRRSRRMYEGQIVVDMGGSEVQLYSGPVRCTLSRRSH